MNSRIDFVHSAAAYNKRAPTLNFLRVEKPTVFKVSRSSLTLSALLYIGAGNFQFLRDFTLSKRLASVKPVAQLNDDAFPWR